MTWFRAVGAHLIVAVVLLITGAPVQAVAQQQTIPLHLALDTILRLDATVTVLTSQIQSGQLQLTATVSGTATVNGTTATVMSQPIAITASVTCRGGSGTLTLSTSEIRLNLSTGLTAVIGAETLMISATCGGQTPTLAVTASPGTVALSDGTVLTTSQCTVTLAASSTTALGNDVCSLEGLICKQLFPLMKSGLTQDAVSTLNQILTQLAKILH